MPSAPTRYWSKMSGWMPWDRIDDTLAAPPRPTSRRAGLPILTASWAAADVPELPDEPLEAPELDPELEELPGLDVVDAPPPPSPQEARCSRVRNAARISQMVFIDRPWPALCRPLLDACRNAGRNAGMSANADTGSSKPSPDVIGPVWRPARNQPCGVPWTLLA